MPSHPTLSSEQHARTKTIFLEACGLRPEERAAFLDSKCPDPEVRAEVEALLEHHQDDPEEERDIERLRQGLTGAEEPAGDEDLPAGSLVADRYRIVGRLGSGGMGQVYRADDLMLKETVALKFLRPTSSVDWLDEVRLARQVTHPNVCRVFDAREVEGKAFISMEYVDGEDLTSLLTRIGRLPRNRTVAIASQLFSGLAAAHAKGVLHRDLKPANIMIDGRGEVRITDFGIARLESEATPGMLAGTPAYMAPEQHRLEEATTRTDLYSLGLVIYEMCTGVFPFEGTSRADFSDAHQNVTVAPPSSHVDDLDATLERVILKCLEKEPGDRPSSALAVAAALPGGDPLSLAVSIGQTPSPQMVAEAGSRGMISTRQAAGLGSLAALLLVVALVLADPAKRIEGAGLDLPPEVLAEKAREKLRGFGWDEPGRDEAWGFLMNDWPLKTVEPGDEGPPDPSAPGASSILFWYRQSPKPMVPSGLYNLVSWGGSISPYDPPIDSGGMALVLLHPSGTLDHLEVRPIFKRRQDGDPKKQRPPPGEEGEESRPSTDFEAMVRSAGLDPARLVEADTSFPPPFFADSRRAYSATTAKRPDLKLDVKMAGFEGRPVYFRMFPEVDRDPESGRSWIALLVGEFNYRWDLLPMIAVLAALPLARNNLRRGRGDQRSARRLAGFVFLTILVLWVLRGPHLADLSGEVAMARLTLGRAMVNAAQVWLFYLALEPYVRRLWPRTLISWTRLLSGRFRDPQVARSGLYGVIFGAIWALILQIDRLLPSWLGLPYQPNALQSQP
ncbi:MAG: serine/threonine-protein kinase, partial [Acidobacteriota bacterium]